MKRLLVPVDGSPSALRAAAHAAERAKRGEQVEVHLLNVQAPVHSPTVPHREGDAILDGYYHAEAEATLRPARRLLVDAGVQCDTSMRIGAVGPAIAACAADHGCDEIVMGMRGHGALGRLVMGSVANHVLHLTPVPVTLVR